jgi:hypothetical protein
MWTITVTATQVKFSVPFILVLTDACYVCTDGKGQDDPTFRRGALFTRPKRKKVGAEADVDVRVLER